MAPRKNTSPDVENRRSRNRLRSAIPGWIMPDSDSLSHPWEVRVRDVSRKGVGFESAEQFASGDVFRIRIGRGPIELARRIRVVRCDPDRAGTFNVGGEFV